MAKTQGVEEVTWTTVTTRKPTNHTLHLILTLLTCGIWAVTGWPAAWAWNTFGPRATTRIQERQYP
jgi:hypothetical protein